MLRTVQFCDAYASHVYSDYKWVDVDAIQTSIYTNNEWLSKEGGGIWLWKETEDGLLKVPCGDPKALKPQKMYGYDEVSKDIGGFLKL